MSGPKLDYAKKSVSKLIEHLKPGDYCGGVWFTTNVGDIFSVEAITDTSKLKMQAEVGKLTSWSATNLAGGMLRGLEFANKVDLPSDLLIRVILFTDGLPNEGPAVDVTGISKLLEANRGRATLSAFAYGLDADQELLTSLAKVGKGNFAYIDNPDKAATAFAKELGGLLSTYAQNIVIEVEPQGGHEITKIVSDVTSTEVGKGAKIEVADLFSEETRSVVLALKTASQTQPLPRPLNVLLLKVGYDLIDDDGKKQHKDVEVKGKIQFVKEGEQQQKPTQDVLNIVGIHQVLEAQIEADKMVAKGDYHGAFTYMQGAQGAMGNQGCQGAASMASYLATGLGDEKNYASFAGARNSVRSAGSSRSLFSDQATENVMYSCDLASSNAVQENMVAAFSGEPGKVVEHVPFNQSVIVGTPVVVTSPVEQKVELTSKGSLSKSKSQRW
jgi:Ca-activated chloride channel family protein